LAERERIAAVLNGKPTGVILPDLREMSPGEAKYRLKKLGLAPGFSGTGGSVLATFPSAFSHLRPGDEVRCVMGKESQNDLHVPDLKGLTLREAISVLDHYGLPFTCRGRGRVKDQIPKPGTVVTDGELVRLALARNAGA
jgi:beta-lactam-binding protein with PASTA domain